MNIGDKVYIVHSYTGWGRNSYTPGVVSKITPSGLIDVQTGPNNRVTRFGKNKKEYAQRYGGGCIDNMPFEERELEVATLNRIGKAAAALAKVTAESRRYDTKEELIAEVERLQALLMEATTLVLGV